MKIVTPRLLWLIWLGMLAMLVALALFPLSTRATRLGGIGLVAILCFGLLALVWSQQLIRWSVMGLLVLCLAFLVLPGSRHPDTGQLRAQYTTGLTRYSGVPYYWGGESPKGIDCSGLMRRGLVDSLFEQGIRTLDPGLARQSISLWWHDCSAQALGEEYRGFTLHLLDTPSINALDHSKLLPGDLAVTQNGVHIMAYLGRKRWIEADPDAGRVITVDVPSAQNVWLQSPMKIMRWRILSDEPKSAEVF